MLVELRGTEGPEFSASVFSVEQQLPAPSLLLMREAAEEAVLLTVRTGSEVDCIGVTASAPIADPQAPQPVDHDRLSVGIGQLAEEIAGAGVERVDVAVAEIADQYVAAKPAEARRSQRHAPRRIELLTLGESRLHLTA